MGTYHRMKEYFSKFHMEPGNTPTEIKEEDSEDDNHLEL